MMGPFRILELLLFFALRPTAWWPLLGRLNHVYDHVMEYRVLNRVLATVAVLRMADVAFLQVLSFAARALATAAPILGVRGREKV